MIRYTGSGKYWKRHLKIHNKEHIQTIWYCIFHDIKSIIEFATMFSKQEEIVNKKNEFGDKIWANLIDENGIRGGANGRIISEETRLLLKTPKSTEHKLNIGKSSKGRIQSIETRLKRSMSQKGISKPNGECPHCHLIGGLSALYRYHFDNCKLK